MRRPTRLVALVLLAVVAAIATGPLPTHRGDQAEIMTASAEGTVAHAAVANPLRPVLSLQSFGWAAALSVAVVLAWLSVNAAGPHPLGVDTRRRRWRSRLVGAPPAPAIA